MVVKIGDDGGGVLEFGVLREMCMMWFWLGIGFVRLVGCGFY